MKDLQLEKSQSNCGRNEGAKKRADVQKNKDGSQKSKMRCGQSSKSRVRACVCESGIKA